MQEISAPRFVHRGLLLLIEPSSSPTTGMGVDRSLTLAAHVGLMSDLPPAQDALVGRRGNSRARLSLRARLESLEGVQPADLFNVSCGGAMVTVVRPPKPGAAVILRYGSVEAFCDVVWTSGCHCGLRFEEKLSHSEVLAARRRSDDQPRLEMEQRRQIAKAWVDGASLARGEGL